MGKGFKNSNKYDLSDQKPGPLEGKIELPEKEPPPPPVTFSKLYRHATRCEGILLVIGLLAALGTGILTPINTLIFGNLTGKMVSYAQMISSGNSSDISNAQDELMSAVQDFAVYNSLIGLGMFILSYIQTEMFNYTATKMIYRIRSLYLQKVLNQDIPYYDVHQSGDFASRISDDLTKFEDGIGEKIPMFVNSQAVFIASLILALVKGWELALICLTSLPAALICIGIIGGLSSKIAKKEMDAYAAAGAIAEEVLSSIRTVIAFGGQHLEEERYDKNLIEAKTNNIRRQMMTAIGFGLLWFFIYGSYALSFWYGVKLILDERFETNPTYDPATMITVFFSVMTGSMNFGISSPYVEAFSVSRAAAAKVYNIIDNVPVINASKNNGEVINDLKGNISFRNVHFKYPSRKDVTVLTGLNLEIKAGDTVALVGSSGCGKSTCIQLIQRFYDPESGEVYLDGKNLKDLDLVWMRSNIGVVGQEPVLFSASIYENILYGNPSATSEEVENAARKANAHEFIKNLPNKYDTLVGERGAQLSGGQKQRIAIARALVRNPAILLLDEATSALDTNSEAKVQAAIDSASKECTTIIVAHRLSTIRNATKIVVISNGKAVEEGTHSELMKKNGEYHKLVMNQVAHDIEDSSDGNESKKMIALTSQFSIQDEEITEMEQTKLGPEEIVKKSLWSIVQMNAPEWPYIVIASAGSIIMGCSMPFFAILFGDIIGILGSTDVSYVHSETERYVIYFVIAGVATGLATFLMIYLFSIAGEKLTMRIRSLMFKAMLRQDMGWYDEKDNGVGALCAKLSGEAAHVQGATGQRIGTILQSLATLFLSVGLSMYYEWRLGLVALAFAPFILIATFFTHRLMNVENEDQHKSLQKSTRVAVEAISNIRTVVSLGCEDKFHQMYLDNLESHYRKTLRNTHARSSVLGLARSLMFFAYSACMYYGGILIKDDGLAFDKVFKVSQALIMGTVSIANALAFSPNFQKGITAAGKVLTLLTRVPKVKDSPNATSKTWSQGNIEYSQVFFSYPTRPDTLVLKGLDLDVLQGKTVALVGPSGCGKSTIVQLIERFYDPRGGEVMVDNDDIRNLSLASLRSHLGIVSQEPNLFDRTIQENIAYGANDRKLEKTEIMEAAKKANIHNFIVSLPLGYDTRLGDKGTQLSGGQKQRIAIARALVRDPKVLLLDEATSALDTESEKVVQEALDNAKKGRTCITIAHRLTTIQDADVICVINKGRVGEMGTHSELINRKGLYYKLHTLQK